MLLNGIQHAVSHVIEGLVTRIGTVIDRTAHGHAHVISALTVEDDGVHLLADHLKSLFHGVVVLDAGRIDDELIAAHTHDDVITAERLT